jgi:hypothetical protein
MHAVERFHARTRSAYYSEQVAVRAAVPLFDITAAREQKTDGAPPRAPKARKEDARDGEARSKQRADLLMHAWNRMNNK